jgi:magnesium transporter
VARRNPYVYKSHHARKRGLPPGTVEFFGDRKQEKTRITLITYAGESTVEEETTQIPPPGSGKFWLNVDGVHDAKLVRSIGSQFSMHTLVMEDIVTSNQRPKAEEYGSYLYIVVRMLTYSRALEDEQVSMVFGKDFLLTFQEHSGDVFEPVRKRLRERSTRIASLGSDYLAYALIDAIVDNYFVVLEAFGDRIETLEEEVLEKTNGSTIGNIQALKRELIRFRRAVWPLREALGSLLREDTELITEYTHRYLRDAYDHCVQIIDTVETFRETVSGLHDIHLTMINNRMSEVMKVLTIIATIFIPLTFIAGVYGMNFEHMPELGWRYGYFIVLGVMLMLSFVMLAYFRRRGWL